MTGGNIAAEAKMRRSQDQRAPQERLVAELINLEKDLAAAKEKSAHILDILEREPALLELLPAEHLTRVRINLADIERIWGEIVDALASLGRS